MGMLENEKKASYIMSLNTVLNTLSNISSFCEHHCCSECPFHIIDRSNEDIVKCQMKAVFLELGCSPSAWDMEEIAWLLNQ